MNDDLTSFRLEQPTRTGGGAGAVPTGRYTPWRSLHFTHGHFITSHASQRMLPDCVFIAASANSFGTVSAEQCYVSVIRGRHEAQLVTGDKEGPKRQIERRSQPSTTVELNAENGRARFAPQECDRLARRETPEQRRGYFHGL